MKKLIATILLAAGISGRAAAQELEVRVRITDELDRPLPEVVMRIDGNRLESFTTGPDGTIRFQARKGAELSFLQFNRLARTVQVTGPDMTVRLRAVDRLFDLGYDEKTTRAHTPAAVEGVTAREIGRSGQFHVLNALYGLIPGLTVRQGQHQPWNTAPSLFVRGRGSFGGNNVVVLVDGVERDASRIDREEIESVTVLKDAASLALYGHRGADGVVNLTTKRGGDHLLRTRIDYNFSVQTPFRIPEMADAPAYAQALNEALENDGLAPRYTQCDIRALLNGEKPALLPQVNWKNELLRKAAFNHELNLSFDGTNQRMRYYVFANYTSNRGLFNRTGLNEGYSTQAEMYALKLRTNLETVLTPATTARINLMGRLLQYQQPAAGTGLDDMYRTPAAAFPVRDPEGGWACSRLFSNPLAEKTARGYGTLLQRTLFGDLTIDQNLSMIAPGLSAQVRIAYDNSAEINDSRTRSYAYSLVDPQTDAAGNVSDLVYSRFGNNTELDFGSGLSWQVMRTTVWGKIGYETAFGRHSLHAAAIYSQSRAKYKGPNNTYMYRDYLARVEYNYADRYVVNGVLTYAGSAKLTRGDKYRLYPALSAAWIVSNERFMERVQTLDYLKLRVSWGVAGSDDRLSYDLDKQFNGAGNGYIFVGTQWENGLAQGSLPSVRIEPEKDYKAGAGIEAGLLNGLTVRIDGFYNRRKNIRVSAAGSVSSVLGIGVPDVFTGEVKHYGAELFLGWQQRIDRFSYAVRGNVSYAGNEIVRMEEAYRPFAYMKYTGQPIGRFYGLEADGFYQTSDFDAAGNLKTGVPVSTYTAHVRPGDVKYRDLNLDGRIDDYDYRYQLRSDLPEIDYGFSLEAAYGPVGFHASFQGAARSTVTTTLGSIYHPLYGNDKNISRHYLENYWTEYTPAARYPRLTTLPNDNNYRASSLWTEQGDFLKLRTLEVYYRLPPAWAGKIRSRECKLFFKGMNLFSVDQVKIMDPEFISTGYPSVRSYLLGVHVAF